MIVHRTGMTTIIFSPRAHAMISTAAPAGTRP